MSLLQVLWAGSPMNSVHRPMRPAGGVDRAHMVQPCMRRHGLLTCAGPCCAAKAYAQGWLARPGNLLYLPGEVHARILQSINASSGNLR